MRIEFRDGSVYEYYDVPEEEFNGLKHASSHGKYFHQNIKNMYDFMFDNFDGDIIGMTDIKSEHNDVLTKRHEILGVLYKLKRSQRW